MNGPVGGRVEFLSKDPFTQDLVLILTKVAHFSEQQLVEKARADGFADCEELIAQWLERQAQRENGIAMARQVGGDPRQHIRREEIVPASNGMEEALASGAPSSVDSPRNNTPAPVSVGNSRESQTEPAASGHIGTGAPSWANHSWSRIGGPCLVCGEGFWTNKSCVFPGVE